MTNCHSGYCSMLFMDSGDLLDCHVGRAAAPHHVRWNVGLTYAEFLMSWKNFEDVLFPRLPGAGMMSMPAIRWG